MDEKIKIVVDGCIFHVSLHKLRLLPDSYFCAALKPHWNHQNEEVNELVIEGRSADLFEHIVDFIRFGCIPRSRNGDCLIDRSLLPLLRVEADYYSLVSMVTEIDELMGGDTVACNMIRDFSGMFTNICDDNCKVIGYDVANKNETIEEDNPDHQVIRYCEVFARGLDDVHREVAYALSGVIPNFSDFFLSCLDNWCPEKNEKKRKRTEMYSMSTKLCEQEVRDNIIDSISAGLNYNFCSEDHIEMDYIIETIVRKLDSRMVNKQLTTGEDHRWLVNTKTLINSPGNTPTISIDDPNSYGTVVFVPSCSSFKGGNLTISQPNSDDDDTPLTVQTDHNCDVKTRCTFVAYQSDCECVVEPVSEGMQVLLVFKIVKRENNMGLRWGNTGNAWRGGGMKLMVHGQHLLSIEKSESLLFSFLYDIIQTCRFIGIILKASYVREGFCEQSLVGFDARLLQAIRQRNLSVSLVTVLHNWQDGTIRILNDRCDTRIETHKNIPNEFAFIGANKKHYGDLFSCGVSDKFQLMAAFIVGGYNASNMESEYDSSDDESSVNDCVEEEEEEDTLAD